MLGHIGLVALGLATLVAGGELLVRGSAAAAARLGVPPLVIGLTIVAFGTSSPELVVSVTAALGGSPGVAFGNVFGSNVANIGLILGLCALVAPLAVHVGLVRREIPLLVGVSVLAGALTAPATVGRLAGIVLLAIFAGIAAYTVRGALRSRARVEVPDAAGRGRSLGWLAAQVVLGLVALGVGSRWTVTGSVALARSAGVPEVVIGATLVALATSLPELVTSVVATARGQADVAVGNVLGSNLFNTLFILGTTAVLAPIPVPDGGRFDVWAGAALAVLLVPLASTHGFRILRWEGGLLVAAYAAYILYRT